MITTTSNSIATATTTAAQQTPKQKTTGLGENFDTFLKLLTTQIKNQDPLQPLDSNQFTQQLVQFSQVEQAINTNDKLSSLVTLQSTNQMVNSLSLVDRTIEFTGDTAPLSNGQAKWSYTL